MPKQLDTHNLILLIGSLPNLVKVYQNCRVEYYYLMCAMSYTIRKAGFPSPFINFDLR